MHQKNLHAQETLVAYTLAQPGGSEQAQGLGWSEGWDKNLETVLLQTPSPQTSLRLFRVCQSLLKEAFITKGHDEAQATFCLHKTESVKWARCSQSHLEDSFCVNAVLF